MKSVKILLRFFCIMIAFMISRAAEQCKMKNSKSRTNESHQLNDLCEREANLIMDFLDDQIEVLSFAKYEELVFVFGAEQTNKTTLVLFLTDAELEAVEASPGSNEIVFIDKDGPLNYYHPNIDSDLIPDLIPYKARGIEFYVMPEHKNKTDTEHDITRTHITQRLFKFATGVKFLFIINYESVKNGEAATDEEREEIKQLTQNATNFIKDIDKYKDSIALVVTHYNSSSIQDEDEFEYINIVKVLEKVQKEFDKQSREPGISEKEKQKCIKNVKFIQIFRNYTVDNEDDSIIYPKIGIFRLANQTGMVRDMEYLQNEKYHIRDIIQEKIQYTRKENDDFNYILMDESKVHIPELMKITEERMLADTININTELKDIHVHYEKENADLKEIYKIMKKGHQVISQINSADPRTFVKQILEAAAILKIEISDSRINTILKHIEFMDFMEESENISTMHRFQVQTGVKETNKYLKESEDWYSFLIELHDNLSKFEVQKNVIEYESNVTFVIEMSAIDELEEINVSDTGLKELLNLVGISMPSNIESMTVNFHKLRSLENVLYRTMMDQATPYCSPGKIEVRGYNVKISSYNEMECQGNITLIDIFAINNLFIDDDIEKTGEEVQIFLIAPTIEIIGNRKFVLNGKDAEPHEPGRADSGRPSRVSGISGMPGKPGGVAGCFLSIGGKYINDKNLKIHLNGGTGGLGQYGGDGV